jgi:hypothetical protein
MGKAEARLVVDAAKDGAVGTSEWSPFCDRAADAAQDGDIVLAPPSPSRTPTRTARSASTKTTRSLVGLIGTQ